MISTRFEHLVAFSVSGCLVFWKLKLLVLFFLKTQQHGGNGWNDNEIEACVQVSKLVPLCG